MAEDRGGREAGTGPRGRGSGSRPSGSRDYDDWDFEAAPRRREKASPHAGSATEAAAVRPPNHRARRALAIAVAAAVLIIAVILLLGSCGSPGQDAVRKYSEAWAKADWATMYAQLTPESQRKVSLIEFAQAGREALATATAPETAVRTAEPQASDNGLWRVPTTVRTRIFGTVRADTLLQVDTEGEEKK
ncbi:MAG: hypothetical protein ACKOTH_11665, partial [Solirubrobacterales bacterium]